MQTLERITASNALVFKTVRLAALRDSPSAFGSTYAHESQLSDADWLQRAAARCSDRSTGYLAMDSAAACGLISGFLDKQDPHKAHLVSMWVAPSHRRTGIGRSLIDAVVTWARDRGVNSLYLTVTSNNQAAIEFYRRNGFSMTGETVPYPNDPLLFEYEMSRHIVSE